jgi:hypothetical protein
MQVVTERARIVCRVPNQWCNACCQCYRTCLVCYCNIISSNRTTKVYSVFAERFTKLYSLAKQFADIDSAVPVHAGVNVVEGNCPYVAVVQPIFESVVNEPQHTQLP